MLGALNKVLLKLCDPRHSFSSSNASPRVMSGRIPHEEPAERHNTSSNRSHNFQSIVNRLPYELLAEIFATICHADSDRFLGDHNRHKKTTPLVLGSVCSHWRIVVWNNPRIWSHISLCVFSPSGRYGAQVSLLKAWFERSGICPLTMNIVFHNEEEWTKVVAHDLINLLVEQAYRWKSINFVLPESWYPLFECIKDNMNQLTTVSTQPLSADCLQSPSRRKRLTLFENAPLLNEVHLNGYYLTDVFLRWHQLTRITLQHVYLDECFHALPLIPNLTWCRIYTILINDVNRIVADRPIHLDQLKKLIVYRAAWGDLMRLLSSMSCVLLESFEISTLIDDLVFPQLSTVLPQFTTHPSALTRFVLSELDFTARPAFKVGRELKALLRDMPMLEELEIEVSKKTDWKDSAFFSWSFIDWLGVQDPGGELEVGHEAGKERGRFDIGSPNDDASNDELLEGRSFGSSSRGPAKSLCETVSRSPCYILPNLHNFTFTGVIFHTCIPSDDVSTGNETTDKCASVFLHPASFHLPGKFNDLGFPRALLEVLSTRGGFGSEWLDTLDATGEKQEQFEEEVKSPEFSAASTSQNIEAATPNPTLKVENNDDMIYFLDGDDDILALPSDVLPGTRSSSPAIVIPATTVNATTATESCATSSPIPQNVCPLPPKSTPLNLRNNLETFNLNATTYRSLPILRATKAKKGAWTCTCCRVGMRGPSDEVKAGLRRLTEEGGMKMKVVVGKEVWV